jgi:hypothetical protein
MQESEAMHHCVFTGEYHKVLQSREVCNRNTGYHGQIINPVKKNRLLFRKQITA